MKGRRGDFLLEMKERILELGKNKGGGKKKEVWVSFAKKAVDPHEKEKRPPAH